MSKSAQAFRTISEVAEWLDVPAHVLRFWESKFTQIKPVKRAGGRRYYRPQDMVLIGGIKTLLHDDGMTIKGVQKVLRERGVKHVSSLSRPLDGYLADGLDDVTPIDVTPLAEDEPRGEVVAFKPSDPVAQEHVPEAELVETPEVAEPEEDTPAATAGPEQATDPDPVPADVDLALPESRIAPETQTEAGAEETQPAAKAMPPLDLVAMMDSDAEEDALASAEATEEPVEDETAFSMLDMPGAQAEAPPQTAEDEPAEPAESATDTVTGGMADEAPPAPPPFFAAVPAVDPSESGETPVAAAADDAPGEAADWGAMAGGIGLSLDDDAEEPEQPSHSETAEADAPGPDLPEATTPAVSDAPMPEVAATPEIPDAVEPTPDDLPETGIELPQEPPAPSDAGAFTPRDTDFVAPLETNVAEAPAAEPMTAIDGIAAGSSDVAPQADQTLSAADDPVADRADEAPEADDLPAMAPEDMPETGALPAFLSRAPETPPTDSDNEPPAPVPSEPDADGLAALAEDAPQSAEIDTPVAGPVSDLDAEPEAETAAQPALPAPNEGDSAPAVLDRDPAPDLPTAEPGPEPEPEPAPVPLGQEIPADPDPEAALEEAAAAPSPLSLLGRVTALTPAQAREIGPLLDRLRAQLDQL